MSDVNCRYTWFWICIFLCFYRVGPSFWQTDTHTLALSNVLLRRGLKTTQWAYARKETHLCISIVRIMKMWLVMAQDYLLRNALLFWSPRLCVGSFTQPSQASLKFWRPLVVFLGLPCPIHDIMVVQHLIHPSPSLGHTIIIQCVSEALQISTVKSI